MPRSFLNEAAQIFAKSRIDHKFYGLKPRHKYFDQLVFFTENLPMKLMLGQITIKPNIEYFTENGVVFKGKSYLIGSLQNLQISVKIIVN